MVGKKPKAKKPAGNRMGVLSQPAESRIFKHSLVSMWEVDISSLRQRVDELRGRGVRGLRSFLDAHPEFVREAGATLVVTGVNDATLRLYEVRGSEQFLDSLRTLVDPGMVRLFREIILALWEGRREIQMELPATTLGGKRLSVIAKCHIPEDDDPDTRMLVNLIDVTDLKRAEDALQETEIGLGNIIDFLPDAAFVINRDGVVIAWNHGIEEMTGVPASEMIGKGGYQYAVPFYGAARPILIDLVREPNNSLERNYHPILKREEQMLIAETWVPRLKGAEALLWGKANILYDSKGNVAGAIESIRDITDRYRAQEALRASEERYRFFLESCFEGLVIAENGVIIDTSPQFFRMLGLEPEEMIGRPSIDFIVSEDRDLVRRKIESRDERTYETRFIRKDGSLLDVELRARHFLYRGREVRVTACHDITERKRAQEKLRWSEEKYRTLVENATEAIFVVQDGALQFSNPSAVLMSGYSEEQLNQRPFIGLVHPDDRAVVRARCENQSWGEKGVPATHAVQILTAAGDMRLLSVTSVLIDWERRPALLCFGSDITERTRTAEALQTLQKLESLGTLAGGIAHDFNNQLTGIMGNISLAMEAMAQGSELRQLLWEALEAGAVARSLTKQLLTFTAGGSPVVQVVDLRGLVREQAVFAVRGTNVKCLLEDAGRPLPAKVDPQQMRQVIQNLVLNAVQAMPQGGRLVVGCSGRPVREGEIPLLEAGWFIEVKVRDEGPGIPANKIGKIFDPFYSTKAQGRGLGLTMCHSIVNRHGGRISVESAPGKGATFTVLIPASEGVLPPGSPRPAPIVKGNGKALVMDDEPGVARVLEKMLGRLGYATTIVSEGSQAVAAYRQARDAGAPFAFVIMDMTIPGGMGGKETIEKLKALDSNVRAIVSSGYSETSDFLAYGFSGVLNKPYVLEDLSRAVRRVLGTID